MYVVYQTTNLVNGKIYIGVTNGNDPYYLGSGKTLKKAIIKYGRKNFIRKPILELVNKESAYFIEKMIVNEKFISENSNYNLQIGGSGHAAHNKERKYKPHTDKTKKKISQTMIERGTSKGKNNPQYGKPLSEKQKAAISRKGVKLTKEHKEKIRQSLTGRKRGPYKKSEKQIMKEQRK